MPSDNTEQHLMNRVQEICDEGNSLKESFFRENSKLVVSLASTIANAFNNGNRLLIFGNGGSAADAQHIAAKFVNRLVLERPALPAIALTTDSSIITSVSNDYGFKFIFSRQIKAFAQRGDVAWGITTSGKSTNVIEGLHTARSLGLTSIAMTGNQDTQAGLVSDIAIEVNHPEAARVQEVHIVIGHVVCELVDAILFQYVK